MDRLHRFSDEVILLAAETTVMFGLAGPYFTCLFYIGEIPFEKTDVINPPRSLHLTPSVGLSS